MAAGRISVQVKTMHEFMTGLKPGGGPRWTHRPGHESLVWIHFWTFPGIADPTACAEGTEAVLNASNGLSEGSR
jgi:hypothetical protein